MVLIQYNWHPYEEGKFGRGVVERQKTGRRLPSTTQEGGLGHIPPRPTEGINPADSSGLDCPASRTGRTHFCCLRPPVCGTLLQKPMEARGGPPGTCWGLPSLSWVGGGPASLQNPGVLVRNYKVGLALSDHQVKAFALIFLLLVAPWEVKTHFSRALLD